MRLVLLHMLLFMPLAMGCQSDPERRLYYEPDFAPDLNDEKRMTDWPEPIFTREDWLAMDHIKRNGWRYAVATHPEIALESEDASEDEKLSDYSSVQGIHERDEWLSLTRRHRNYARLMLIGYPDVKVVLFRHRLSNDAIDARLEDRYESAAKPTVSASNLTGFIIIAIIGGAWFTGKSWKPPEDAGSEASQAAWRIRNHRALYWVSIVALYVFGLLFVVQSEQMLSFSGIVRISSTNKITFPVVIVAQLATWVFFFPLLIALVTSLATGCSNILALAVFLFACFCQTILSGLYAGETKRTDHFISVARSALPLISFIVAIVRAVVSEM